MKNTCTVSACVNGFVPRYGGGKEPCPLCNKDNSFVKIQNVQSDFEESLKRRESEIIDALSKEHKI